MKFKHQVGFQSRLPLSLSLCVSWYFSLSLSLSLCVSWYLGASIAAGLCPVGGNQGTMRTDSSANWPAPTAKNTRHLGKHPRRQQHYWQYSWIWFNPHLDLNCDFQLFPSVCDSGFSKIFHIFSVSDESNHLQLYRIETGTIGRWPKNELDKHCWKDFLYNIDKLL